MTINTVMRLPKMLRNCMQGVGKTLKPNLLMRFQNIHSGVGPPLSPERTRALLALRINVMAKGFSGISLHVMSHYIDAFNGKLSTPIYLVTAFHII